MLDLHDTAEAGDARLTIRRGERFRLVLAGGGHGDPLAREAERVLKDVTDGKVTVEHARDAYGVAIVGRPPRVDVTETDRLRAARR